MILVTGHMVYFSAYARSEIFQNKLLNLEGGCESLFQDQILNTSPRKRNKSTSFYESRGLLVASLSGGVDTGCKY